MTQDNMPNEQIEKPATLPAANSGNEGQNARVISKMEAVKSVWDTAREGEKKDIALKHYQSAEKARLSGNSAEALRERGAATRALT